MSGIRCVVAPCGWVAMLKRACRRMGNSDGKNPMMVNLWCVTVNESEIMEGTSLQVLFAWCVRENCGGEDGWSLVVKLSNCGESFVVVKSQASQSSMRREVVLLMLLIRFFHAHTPTQCRAQYPNVPFLAISSLVSHHLCTTITIVQVVTEAYHAIGASIITANSPWVPSAPCDGLYTLCTSWATKDFDSGCRWRSV